MSSVIISIAKAVYKVVDLLMHKSM